MADIAELVAQLQIDDQAQASQALQMLRQAVNRATDPNKSAEREALADQLVAELATTVPAPEGPRKTNVPDNEPPPPVPKHSSAARRQLCQLLNQIAGDNQVPQLAPLLADLEVRDAVRCVLQAIPTLVATMALVKGLAQMGPEFRVGVINALGQERWREAMVTVARAAKDTDPEVRLAALDAVANFPEAANDALFVAATKTGTPRERARAQAARVRLAETLRWFGEEGAAAQIYQSIAADSADGPWKRAASRALATAK